MKVCAAKIRTRSGRAGQTPAHLILFDASNEELGAHLVMSVTSCSSQTTQVYEIDYEAPARLVEVAALQEHDDLVSSVAVSRSQEALVVSGSHDRR